MAPEEGKKPEGLNEGDSMYTGGVPAAKMEIPAYSCAWGILVRILVR
jgi:hypothetical protein